MRRTHDKYGRRMEPGSSIWSRAIRFMGLVYGVDFGSENMI